MLRGRALPLCLAGAYVLLGVGWAMSNAPFTSPDERAHYLRAIGVSGGSLIGAKTAYDDPTQSPETRAWVKQIARSVPVPGGFSPDDFDCPVLRPVSAACQPDRAVREGAGREVSIVGTYQPLPYLLPAAVVRAGASPAGADRLGRLACLLVWAALVVAGAVALWSPRRGPLALLGMVVALTPMTVFVGASLTGSGLEIASAFAFAAAVLRLTREGSAPTWVWVMAAIAGAAVALSRTTGPLWVLAALGAAVLVGGWRPLRGAAVQRRGAAWIAGGVVLLAIVLDRVWEAAYAPTADTGFGSLRDSLGTGWRQLDGVLLQAVGKFGHLQVGLPAVAYAAWGLMAAALLGLALWASDRRGRWVLGACVLACGAFPVVFYAAVARNAGIPLQGRHVLPLFVIVTLLVGEAAYRRADRIPARLDGRLLAALTVPAGAIQAVAWWVNSRRWAVGPDGATWFLGSADWSPPGGWVVWLALVALGAVALALSPILAGAGQRRSAG